MIQKQINDDKSGLVTLNRHKSYGNYAVIPQQVENYTIFSCFASICPQLRFYACLLQHMKQNILCKYKIINIIKIQWYTLDLLTI